MRRCLVALLVSGCSLLAVHGPVTDASTGAIDCTQRYVLPAIDVAAAAIAGVGGGVMVVEGATAQSGDRARILLPLGVVPLVVGAIYVASAAQGFATVTGCRATLADPHHRALAP